MDLGHNKYLEDSINLTSSLSLQSADEGEGDGKLDFDEFCQMFNELSERKELRTLFSLYSSKQEWLTVHDLQRFLRIEQGNVVS